MRVCMLAQELVCWGWGYPASWRYVEGLSLDLVHVNEQRDGKPSMSRGSRLMLLTLLLVALLLLWQTQMRIPTARAPAVGEAGAPLIGATATASSRLAAAQEPATYSIPDTAGSAFPAAVSQCGPAPGPSSAQEPLSPVGKPGSCPASLLEVALSACRIATSRLGAEGELLLVGASDEAAGRRGGTGERADRLVDLGTRLLVAQRAVGSRLLLVACSREEAQLARALRVAWWRVPPAPGAYGASSALWRAAAALLSSGLAVVVSNSGAGGMMGGGGPGQGLGGGASRGDGASWASDGGALWLADPWAHLSRDVDVEVTQLLDPLARADKGSVVGTSDPGMGWSAYAQTMATPLLDPTVVALQPTAAAAEMAAAYARALAAGPPPETPAEPPTGSAGGLEGVLVAGGAAAGDLTVGDPSAPVAGLWSAWQLTRLALQPAHDAESRPGVSVRLLRRVCFAANSPRGPLSAVPASVAARVMDAGSVSEALLGLTAAAEVRRAAQEAVGPSGGLGLPITFAEPEAPPVAPGDAGPPMRLREGGPDEILSSVDWRESEARILTGQGCRAPVALAGSLRPRPARWVVPPGAAWPLPALCAANEDARDMCEVLREAALEREVLVAVSACPPSLPPTHTHTHARAQPGTLPLHICGRLRWNPS
jgi:hypothetical protein